ncbi:MAG: hypothetical protein AAGB01_11140 [Cyanobacteria bacterium P01_F01_bin.42]
MAIIALLAFSVPSIQSPAIAAAPTCTVIKQHEVCIRRMKRSAKRYWEYWAIVDVDGQRRPKETYNCRDRVLVDRDNILVPFEREIAGDFVCQLYVDKQTFLDRLKPPQSLSSSN